MIPYFNCL